MFSWATSKLESLVQTVAPPPTDSNSKFLYCCQQGDEAGALLCFQQPEPLDGISSLPVDPFRTILVQLKGYTALHLACLHTMSKLLEYILSQNDGSIDIWQVRDAEGNTPLHCACMSNSPNALQMIKSILMYGYSSADNFGQQQTPPPVQLNTSLVGVTNFRGETPYDVAALNSVRQYLLPIQLQAETQVALQNGGSGLPPGIDMGGLKVQNSSLPPPPSAAVLQANGITIGPAPPISRYVAPVMPDMGQQRPLQQQVQHQHAPPQQYNNQEYPPAHQNQIHQHPISQPQSQQHQPPLRQLSEPSSFTSPPPPQPSISRQQSSTTTSTSICPPEAPKSSDSGYALVGGSSAALYTRPGGRIQPNDGFHSSSSDKNLQAKYGHSVVNQNPAIPPPPTSGNTSMMSSTSADQLNSQFTAPPVIAGGPNPFAGGATLGSRRLPIPNTNRYVNYDPIRGSSIAPLPPPPPPVPSGSRSYPSFSMFTPGVSTDASMVASSQSQQMTQQPINAMPPLPPPPSIGSRTSSYNNQMSGYSNAPMPFSSPNQQLLVQPTPANTPVALPAGINDVNRTPNKVNASVLFGAPGESRDGNNPFERSPQVNNTSSGNALNVFGTAQHNSSQPNFNGNPPTSSSMVNVTNPVTAFSSPPREENVNSDAVSTFSSIPSSIAASQSPSASNVGVPATDIASTPVTNGQPLPQVSAVDLFSQSQSTLKVKADEGIQDEEDDSMMDEIPLTPWPEQRKESIGSMNTEQQNNSERAGSDGPPPPFRSL